MGMAARHGKIEWLPGTVGRLAVCCLLLSGCSVGAGNRLTLFPQGHRLLDSAKAITEAQTEPAPLPRELDKRVLPAYVVEPGDVLLVVPADLDSPVRLPGDQPVLPDGTIRLGRYGPLVVAGQTLDQVEAAVNALIKSRTKNAGPITVRLVSRVSKVYYVLGEVNSPGSFPLQGREAVLDGIIAAGGLTDRASHRHIILSRPTNPRDCRVVLPICYQQIVQLGDTSTNYQLAPGDRIFVATRTHSGSLFHKNKPDCSFCSGPQVGCPVPPSRHCDQPQPVSISPSALGPGLPNPIVSRGACPDSPESRGSETETGREVVIWRSVNAVSR
jgi:protein involved in polysaccharide export with SLBB domain